MINVVTLLIWGCVVYLPVITANTTLVDGIYWSERVERWMPRGYPHSYIDKWRKFMNESRVVKVEEGCGRMQNRYVVLEGGVSACCRYRQNNDQIQGEIFSYYLSQLLQLENLPPTVLSMVNGHSQRWNGVSTQLSLAQWTNDRPVVLTKFVDGLVPAYIPIQFRTKNRRLHPIDDDLDGRSRQEVVELVQWSDLILFDYLTANLDRVVNNMYNEQWNSEMMRSPAHNLAKCRRSGLLIFLDNESGLVHGYRLLDKYEQFHRSLLDSLCVFRKRTTESIKKLRHRSALDGLLKRSFQNEGSSVTEWLPYIPEKTLRTLQQRMDTVYRHIRKCEKRYRLV